MSLLLWWYYWVAEARSRVHTKMQVSGVSRQDKEVISSSDVHQGCQTSVSAASWPPLTMKIPDHLDDEVSTRLRKTFSETFCERFGEAGSWANDFAWRKSRFYARKQADLYTHTTKIHFTAQTSCNQLLKSSVDRCSYRRYRRLL
jgi:hypothetical protein